MMRLPAAAALALLLAGPVLSGRVLAHGALKSASPADGATISAAPASVKLEFSEKIELAFSSVKITGPGKAAVTTGAASNGGGSANVLEVPVTGTLAPGVYRLEWRILSKDGHKTKGAYTFTLKP